MKFMKDQEFRSQNRNFCGSIGLGPKIPRTGIQVLRFTTVGSYIGSVLVALYCHSMPSEEISKRFSRTFVVTFPGPKFLLSDMND